MISLFAVVVGFSPCSISHAHAPARASTPLCLAKKKSSGPPPIDSRYFVPLATPADYAALLADAEPRAVSVVKFQASWCRTCRATAPLLDRIAKAYPDAAFFSLTKYPRLADVQLDRPITFANLPLSHSSHSVDPSIPANQPASHFVCFVLPNWST